MRAVVYDPLRRTPELYLSGEGSDLNRLAFRDGELSELVLTKAVEGEIRLYREKTIDPQNPVAHLAVSVKVDDRLSKVILVLFPAEREGEYRSLLIDDSPGAFPYGESRLINATSVDVGLAIGEHKLAAEPGEVKVVPAVKHKDDFNMAQTDFVYRREKEGSWKPFSQRRLKYVDQQRRIFVAGVSKRASAPTVTTVIDLAPLAIPD
ncbi:hypothetical protein [Roseibacillus ishigakijimensis]|uniref:Uncharacterized protein n=1 Tax=Roseibacillus ishigakijimensis TaxID=454146 RepID=A0A934RQI2_9BACT|nr:hypothetical protein [Roseibacillus ishigakijimensis]MBK1833741.1 hypothetical protein [Roseibacillus ishigakijimensis]